MTENTKNAIPDFRNTVRVDQTGIEERASRITKRSIKTSAKLNPLWSTIQPEQQ